MSDMEQLLIESNDLKQRLSGFESQRNHLMENISILETSLQQKNEEFRLLHDELRSDQEVIAFLDQRVHDLETKCQALEEEKTRAMSTVDAIKNATQKQLIVMGDMLKFERENLNENEKEWKATKKVLVKEIKNCRAQILTLQSERDAYSEQCAKYREALLQSGGFSSFKER
jgi:chromosome segregation ATPase